MAEWADVAAEPRNWKRREQSLSALGVYGTGGFCLRGEEIGGLGSFGWTTRIVNPLRSCLESGTGIWKGYGFGAEQGCAAAKVDFERTIRRRPGRPGAMHLELPNWDWIATQFPTISKTSAVSDVDISRSVPGYDGACGVFRVSPAQTLALAIQFRAKCHYLVHESTVIPSYSHEKRNADMTRGNLPGSRPRPRGGG
jgi:hypothetical protein